MQRLLWFEHFIQTFTTVTVLNIFIGFYDYFMNAFMNINKAEWIILYLILYFWLNCPIISWKKICKSWRCCKKNKFTFTLLEMDYLIFDDHNLAIDRDYNNKKKTPECVLIFIDFLLSVQKLIKFI